MALFTVMHAAMPYCLQKQPDNTWVILNREYKPLGFLGGLHNYGDYPIAMNIQGLTARVADKISCNPNPDPNCIYLYNDGCVPTHSDDNMADYLRRLAVLGPLKLAQT